MTASFLSRKKAAIAWVILLSAVFFVYSPCLSNGFVNWDDDVHLTGNPFVTEFARRGIKGIFLTTVNGTYIPLTTLSFVVEHQLFGPAPFFYHLNNILLHLAITGLVFVFLRRIGGGARAALLAALLFGLHPQHVESVAWVTERKDVLYGLFYMLSLLSYVRYVDGVKRREDGLAWLVLTFVLGLLSLLAKPMALSLPLVLAVLDWYLRRPWTVKGAAEKFACVFILFFPAWLTYQAHMRVPQIEFPGSFVLWVWCLVFPLKKFIVPFNLAVIYPPPHPLNFQNPELLLSTAALAGMVWLLARRSEQRQWRFAFLFYLASIFFLLRYDTAADVNVTADRFMYLPSLGFCFVFGMAVDRFLRKMAGKKRALLSARVGVGAGFVLLGLLTMLQCRVWKSGRTLWTQQVRVYPAVHRAMILERRANSFLEDAEFKACLNRLRLGRPARHDILQFQTVEGLYRQALRLKPDYAQVVYSLGWLYQDIDNIAVSTDLYMQTLRLDPSHFEAAYRLGVIFAGQGDSVKAVKSFRQAVDVNPDNRELIRRVAQAVQGVPRGRGPVYDELLKELAVLSGRF